MKTQNVFILCIMFFLCSLQPAGALDPNPDVDKGTSPGKWLDQVLSQNKDKWDVRSKIPIIGEPIRFVGLTGGMLKILLEGNKQLNSWQFEKPWCKSAAVNEASIAMSNSMAGGAGLDAVLEIVSLIKSIVGAQGFLDLLDIEALEKKIREAIEDGANDKVGDLLKELFSKSKSEVYFSKAIWGTCDVVTLSIWDKAAAKYEIIIYGDCACTPMPIFLTGRKENLKTFAVRLTGSVSPKLEANDLSFEAKGGTRTVHANCKCSKPGDPVPKETPGQPTEPPAEQEPRPLPPENLTTKCKECLPIVDEIKRGHAELNKNEREARGAQSAYDGAIKSGRSKEATEFKVKVIQLGVMRLQLERRLKDLAAKLQECENEKCSVKASGGAPPQQNTPTGNCPACQKLEDQIRKNDADIQKKNGEMDNARRIWEKEGPDNDKGKKAKSDYDRLIKEIENLSKQTNDLQEKLPDCIKENCPPGAIDSCLVGTWMPAVGEAFQGYRVTFTANGTQVTDYANSQPLKLGSDTITWRGLGANRISTKDSAATVVETREGNVTMTLESPVVPKPVVWKMGTRMGFAGLGDTTGDNHYVCTRVGTQEKDSKGQGDTLTYQGSSHRERLPNFAVRLIRAKE